jgi:hypothetical protein
MPTKPGYKTSEFWLTLAAQALGAVTASGLPSGNPWMQAAGLGLSALSLLGYQQSRAAVKKNSMAEALGAGPRPAQGSDQ